MVTFGTIGCLGFDGRGIGVVRLLRVYLVRGVVMQKRDRQPFAGWGIAVWKGLIRQKVSVPFCFAALSDLGFDGRGIGVVRLLRVYLVRGVVMQKRDRQPFAGWGIAVWKGLIRQKVSVPFCFAALSDLGFEGREIAVVRLLKARWGGLLSCKNGTDSLLPVGELVFGKVDCGKF